ncbi:MAG: DEAD/DEAH box helicase [Verrucomicrobiota bacterium]
MNQLIAAIRNEPELVTWIRSGLWKRSFDRGSLGRAEGYANPQSVELTEINRTAGINVGCEARVKSAKSTYQTRVAFFSTTRAWAVQAECTCPVGHFCKHGAAIILMILDDVAPAPVMPAPAPSSPSLPVREDPRVSNWLEGIRNASKSLKAPPKRAVEDKRFLAFCLQPLVSYLEGNPWFFTLRVGTRLKNGGFSISDTAAQADPSKPPKYLVRDDFVPASIYYQRKRRENCWDEMRLAGSSWEELLATAAATNRLYVSGPEDGMWTPARSGPDIPATAVWEMRPDGDAQPKLVFADGEPRIVLPTLPPRYIERNTGRIGLLISDLPDPLLASWISGPPVPSRLIPTITEQLQQLAPELPSPVAVETVQLRDIPPKPHLVVRKKSFGTGYSKQEHIHAILFFRYGDSRPLLSLSSGEKPVHYEMREGRRYIRKRDPKAELAAERRLLKLGFLPLAQRLPFSHLDEESSHAVILANSIHAGVDDWLDFIESPDMAGLQDDGWTLQIDPSSGLLIHDAGGFFPRIEAESDHGIEWFRFDAQFEIDGRRLSLIPIIASAIRRNLPSADSPELPEFFVFPCDNPADGSIRFPARRLMEMVDQVRHLFHGHHGEEPVRIDRLGAAGVAASLALDHSETLRALARLAHNLRNIHSIPGVPVPDKVTATLRDYQAEGFHWLQFLADHSLHGILADDMGLGKTVQALTHLAAESAKSPGRPSLVIAPTSVVTNWSAEAEKFTPHLKVVMLQGKDRGDSFRRISEADLVITSYPLLTRDFEILSKQDWHLCILDEAQYIKNSKAIVAKNVCQLRTRLRLCLSGTPMENHLGELWSLMRFLMPGFLGDETTFNSQIRKPIERDRSRDAQLALNRRVSPLILRRTKDQVAKELPPKTELIHSIELTKEQTDLYESVRAAMDKRVREAISANGLAKSHIIVLDALLKLRQICCHPQLLKNPAAQKVADSAKLDYLTDELLPTLLEEGRRILLFSSFTSMLELIEAHLEKEEIPFLKLTGRTQDRASLVKRFQAGEVPIFLISLKAGGTGLNLTAADTVIHYDPWWNPAAENQATDRAHRIGQTKPVFVHKLVCTGTIEDRILELQKHKSALVEALLSEETSKLKIDSETLSHLLAPLP